MSTTNLATLNDRLSRRPEPIREDLARYITERLDEIEDEMHWTGNSAEISDELRTELDRRMEAYERNPKEGVTWEVLKNRLLGSK